jgi:AcrR family transcriptional regulator
MRMTKAQKEEARGAIVVSAGRLFREQGRMGIGVDAIAKDIGQTSGAIYAHFSSKTDLFRSVIEAGFARLRQSIDRVRDGKGSKWGGLFATQYLSPDHRAAIGNGCLLPTLTPDVGRASEPLRELFGEQFLETAKALAEGFESAEKREAEERAIVILALCAGGLMLSRAAPDGHLANRILSACRAAAEREAELPKC